jgi:hypothetical protein
MRTRTQSLHITAERQLDDLCHQPVLDSWTPPGWVPALTFKSSRHSAFEPDRNNIILHPSKWDIYIPEYLLIVAIVLLMVYGLSRCAADGLAPAPSQQIVAATRAAWGSLC